MYCFRRFVFNFATIEAQLNNKQKKSQEKLYGALTAEMLCAMRKLKKKTGGFTNVLCKNPSVAPICAGP